MKVILVIVLIVAVSSLLAGSPLLIFSTYIKHLFVKQGGGSELIISGSFMRGANDFSSLGIVAGVLLIFLGLGLSMLLFLLL